MRIWNAGVDGVVLEIKRPTDKRFMVPMRIETVPERDEAGIVIAAEFAEAD